MQTLKWSDVSNGVYLTDIDQEHQDLFQMTDEIYQALQADRIDEVGPLVRQLTAEVVEHFSHEEKMMKSRRYPAYTWHKSQHNVVRGKVAALEQATQLGDREAIVLILDFFAAWLKTHTAVSDRMMCAFLRNSRKHRHAAQKPA